MEDTQAAVWAFGGATSSVVVITIIIAFHEAALAIIQLDGELFIKGKRLTSTDQ